MHRQNICFGYPGRIPRGARLIDTALGARHHEHYSTFKVTGGQARCYTFQECSGLHSILLPSTVKQIGLWSFSKCLELKDFYLYADICPSTDIEAFYETPIENATLHVPAASVEIYKQTAPWSGFGKIVPLKSGDPTSINIQPDTVIDNNNGSIWYDLNGVRQSEPKKGINIVNGKKVVVK